MKVAIIGASSLTGQKLIEILNLHPNVEIVIATSHTYVGHYVPVAKAFKYECLDIDKLAETDVVFSCLPHGKSTEILEQLVGKVKLIVDLGADFRPSNDFEKWYGIKRHFKDESPLAVYGLSEVFTEKIEKANFIANPGCYPTSVLLALAPLLNKGIKLDDVGVYSLSGRSGTGREKSKELAENKENVFSYKDPYNHQHIGEIEYVASKIGDTSFKLFYFSPHVLCDIFQGMHTTVLAKCEMDSFEELLDIYVDFYKNQPFIKICKTKDNRINLSETINTNNCILGLDYEPKSKRLYIVSVLDNLIKGASGQAVQNMNLALGWDQTMGLRFLSLQPRI